LRTERVRTYQFFNIIWGFIPFVGVGIDNCGLVSLELDLAKSVVRVLEWAIQVFWRRLQDADDVARRTIHIPRGRQHSCQPATCGNGPLHQFSSHVESSRISQLVIGTCTGTLPVSARYMVEVDPFICINENE